MPVTMVRKITGAMIILISLMNPSPSGFSASPVAGAEMADQYAEQDRDHHLDIEVPVPCASWPTGTVASLFKADRSSVAPSKYAATRAAPSSALASQRADALGRRSDECDTCFEPDGWFPASWRGRTRPPDADLC